MVVNGKGRKGVWEGEGKGGGERGMGKEGVGAY